jgi:hypothetical protein
MAPVIVAPIGLFALSAYFVLLTFAFITIFFRIGLFVRSFTSCKDISISFGQRILWTAAATSVTFRGKIPWQHTRKDPFR